MIKIRIIISPAKKMNIDNDILVHRGFPRFIGESRILLDYLQSLSYEELKRIWKCSDKLAKLNFDRVKNMDLDNNLTPALLSYEGLQYKYMGAHVFTEGELDYLDRHLRILSAFYGVLKAFDGVVPYRLEMEAKLIDWDYPTMYDFWQDKIAKSLFSETDLILDLASKEYSRVITRYLPEDIRLVECVFGQIIDGKIKEKATLAKMARGEMVRFLAEERIDSLEQVKKFTRLDYAYREDLSQEDKLIFIKS